MGSFKISTSSWHWKMYMFAVAMWAKFMLNPLCKYERPNTCAYLRMILVYQPIILTLNTAIYTSPLWVGMLLGHYYGYWIIMEIFPHIGGFLLLIIGIIFGLAVCAVIYALLSILGDSAKEKIATKNKDHRSFTHTLLQGIEDKHDMICRPIVPVTPEVTTSVATNTAGSQPPTHTDSENPEKEASNTEPTETKKEEHPLYVRIVHRISLTLGKVFVLSVMIVLAGWALWLAADSTANKESFAPRELCKVTDSQIIGYGDTSTKSKSVEIHANCSFGVVVQKSNSFDSILAVAMTKPTELPCYTKKYRYTTVSGCDLPK